MTYTRASEPFRPILNLNLNQTESLVRGDLDTCATSALRLPRRIRLPLAALGQPPTAETPQRLASEPLAHVVIGDTIAPDGEVGRVVRNAGAHSARLGECR